MPVTFSGSTWVDASQAKFDQKRKDALAYKRAHAPGDARKHHQVVQMAVRKNWHVDVDEIRQQLIIKIQQHSKRKAGGGLYVAYKYFAPTQHTHRDGQRDTEAKLVPITLSSFQEGVKNFNFDVSTEVSKKLFEMLDKDGDGTIDLQEFQRGLMPGQTEQQVIRRELKRAQGPQTGLDMKIKTCDRALVSIATPMLGEEFQMGGGRKFPRFLPKEKEFTPRPPEVQSVDKDTIMSRKADKLRKQRAERYEAGLSRVAPKTTRVRARVEGDNPFSAPMLQHKGGFRCSTYRG